MNQVEFGAAMAQRGCVGDGKAWCGSFNSYPFMVTFQNGRTGGKTVALLQMQFAGPVSRKFLKDMHKTHKPNVAVVNPGGRSTGQTAALAVLGGYAAVAAAGAGSAAGNASTGLMTLQLKDKTNEAFLALLDRVLADVTMKVPQYGMALPGVCPLCKSPNCDSYAYVQGSYRPVHAHCVQALAQNTQEKAQKNLYEGNYALGAIGAILGAFVGALPSVLFAVFTGGGIWAWLCALIPLGAYYGYKLFRGKRTKVSIVFVILASLIAVPFLDYMLTAVLIMMEGYEWISLTTYIEYVTYNMNSFVGDWLLELLFVAIGFAIVSGIVTRTAHHEVQTASYSALTLRPIYDGQVAPAPQPGVPVQQAPAAPQPPVPGIATEK